MSNKTSGKMLGILLMLSLALTATLVMPLGSAEEGMATLKVVVKNQKMETLDEAAVYCENVHTGASSDLFWNSEEGWFEAEVMPGSYQIFASAENYIGHDPEVVYMLTEKNDNVPHLIILTEAGRESKVKVNVTYDADGMPVKNAKVHFFGDNGVHLMKMTDSMGYANFSIPVGTLHMVVFARGMLTADEIVIGADVNNQMINVSMVEEPSTLEDSFRILGFVKSGNLFVPNLRIHLWDVDNEHMVPIGAMDDGALSIPAYPSKFNLLIEADGYEAFFHEDIVLDTEMTYFRPDNQTFKITKIENEETKVTTINMGTVEKIGAPMAQTVWTMDANSRFYGSVNDFGNPRMQIAGGFYTSNWKTVDEGEVNSIREELGKFGPAWIDTDDFLKVNDFAYSYKEDSYTVSVSGLEGNSTDEGINPVVTMSNSYVAHEDFEFEKGDDLRVEVLSVLDNEEIVIILPDNYEILGDFDDSAVFPYDGNSNQIRVMEPLEFVAKKEESPIAEIEFVNYYDFYSEEDKEYFVNINSNITLSGVKSSDPVGKIVEYIWTIPGDATYVVEAGNLTGDADTEADIITLNFTKNSNKFFNVTLKVKDSSGELSKADWIHLMPDGASPVVNNYTLWDTEEEEYVMMEGGMYHIDEDMELEFNATNSTDNSKIVDYIWNFGDDSGTVNGDVVDHRYADPGRYNISLKVVDAVGNERKLANRTIMVRDTTLPAPVIKPFPDVTQGDVVEFNGTQSYDPRTTGNDYDAIVSYTWTFVYDDENITLSGDVVNYTFDIPGDYIINLTVEDEAGQVYWTEKTLFVSGPDLQVRTVNFRDPDENHMNGGEKTHVSVVIANDGLYEAKSNWTIQVFDRDRKVKEQKITAVIGAGETHEFNFTFKLRSGEREIKVILDTNNDVPETLEDNNEYTTTIDVEDPEPIFEWWWFAIALAVVLVVYVVFMKVTRDEWGYEVIVEWWKKRNA
ncbi:MAG: PKD domain-containing protein [Thermoplasmatota archaeon]